MTFSLNAIGLENMFGLESTPRRSHIGSAFVFHIENSVSSAFVDKMRGKLLAMYDNSMGNFNSLAGLPSAIKDYDWTIHSVFLLAGAVLFIWYTVSTVRAYWRLREFQGPPLAAFTNLWYAKAVTTYKPHLILGDVCTKYGSLARIGPNTLLTCDEELIRRMNAARSTYHRGDWYRAFKFDAERENLLSEPDEVKHVEMRKKVAAGYAGKDNPTLERDMDDILWQLITLIKDRYISNGSSLKKFDLAAAAQYFTLDTITCLALGQPLGWLKNDQDMYLYATTLAKNLPLMNFVSAIPFFIHLMRHPIVQRMMMPSLKAKVGVGKIKGVVGQIVGQRFTENKVVREDMIQSFIKNGLTQGEIADEGMLQLFAGSDTTSTVLRSGLFYIITNPRVCTRLQAECDASGVPLTEIISAAKGPTLPYLNACVKEALRYHPAGTGLLPRVVGPNGDYHEGKYLPPGTTIGFCGWNVFKNNSAYGPDYSEFRPERWLDADPERLARMEKAHDLVFGYGRYKCMGEKIARIELHKAIFELIRRFNFTAVDAMKPFDQYENHGVFVQHGLWVRAEERVPKTKE